MSITAIGDILIHLSRVQNIDCFGNGFFKVKIEVFRKSPDVKTNPKNFIFAKPHFIPQKPFQEKKASNVREAYIDPNGQQYIS